MSETHTPLKLSDLDTAIRALQEAHANLLSQPEPPKPPAHTVESVYGRTLAGRELCFDGHLPLMEDGRPVMRHMENGDWFLSARGLGPQQWDRLEASQYTRLILQPRRRLVYPVIREGQPGANELFRGQGALGQCVFTGGSLDAEVRTILGPPVLEEY